MLSTTDNTIPFDKAIEEINAIAKLAGLSGGYSFGDRAWELHNMEIFLAAPKKTMGFSPNGEDDEEDIQKEALMWLVIDDFAHLNAFMGMFAMYLLKASGAIKNPSPVFDALYQRLTSKLNQVADGSAAKFGIDWGLGKKLHKDKDMQRASDILKDIANLFTKYHS